MIHGNGRTFLMPEGDNPYIYLDIDETVYFYCSEGFVFDAKLKKIDAKCIGSDRYIIAQLNETEKKRRTFNEIQCKSMTEPATKIVGDCLGKNAAVVGKTILIGFDVPKPLTFMAIAEVCHDDSAEMHRTHYSRYKLQRANFISENDKENLDRQFREDYFEVPNPDPRFKIPTISSYYSLHSQNYSFRQAIGLNEANRYFNMAEELNMYISRGHQLARKDVIFVVMQRATYYYINVGPQFQLINGGSWEYLEIILRAFVADENIVVEVITGNIGILVLRDCRGAIRSIFLNYGGRRMNVNPSCPDADFTNTRAINRSVPVPQFFYKLIMNWADRSGVVFLSVNDPLISVAVFKAQVARICNDILDQLTWIKFTQESSRGLMAACDVNEFVQKVHHLPANIAEGINKILNGKVESNRNRNIPETREERERIQRENWERSQENWQRSQRNWGRGQWSNSRPGTVQV